MDLTVVFIYIFIMGYLGMTMYIANQEQLGESTLLQTRTLLFGAPIMASVLGLYMLMAALASQQIASLPEAERQQFSDVAMPEITTPVLLISLFMCSFLAFLMMSVINSAETRLRLRRLLDSRVQYNPDSPVHTTAVVFILLLSLGSTILFFIVGGTEGVAESIEEQGISIGEPLFNAGVQVIFALLGIGLAIRRGFPESMARLGLRLPTRSDFRWGLGVLVPIFIILWIYGFVISQFISPEVLDEQTQAAQNMNAAFSTLPLALIVAASAAIGEEIFFRGALQPIFGLIPTTLFFAVWHIQVLLTPGIIVILIVSLIFGIVRQRQSTTAAIIAHFAYDFLVLFISMTISSGGGAI